VMTGFIKDLVVWSLPLEAGGGVEEMAAGDILV
jgi:hypothetical protein